MNQTDNTTTGPALDALCPWCKQAPEVHNKNHLGIRYLGCPTRGCVGRGLHFIIDHLWNTRIPAASAAPTVEERRVDIALGYIVNDARVLAKDVTGPIAGRIALTLYQLCDEIELLDKQIVELTDECGNWRARAEDLAGHALEDDK